jgi:hypothetical protein
MANGQAQQTDFASLVRGRLQQAGQAPAIQQETMQQQPQSQPNFAELVRARRAQEPKPVLAQEIKKEAPQAKGLQSVLEPIFTIASSVAAEVPAAVATIASAPFQGLAGAVETGEKVRGALTFKPKSDAARKNLANILKFSGLEALGRGLEASEEFLVEKGLEAGGVAGGTALGAIPLIALESLPFLGRLKGLTKKRGASQVEGITDETFDGLESQGVNIDNLSPEDVNRIQTAEAAKVEDSIGRLTPGADRVTEEAIQASRPSGDSAQAIGAVKAGQTPELKDYSDIVDDIKKAKEKRVAMQVLPDEQIREAAESLNLDLNPSHYSTNQKLIEVEQAIKSTPGSHLAAKEVDAIEGLGNRADELIKEIGGATDKSLLDAKLKGSIDDAISSLELKSNNAYSIVDKAIPKSTKVDPGASKAFIASKLDELGDESLLNSSEKRLAKLLENPNNPTYAAIDRLRKDVGNALGKKSDVFKSDDAGQLSQMYKVLSEDQQGVADIMGVGEDYAAARKLVSTRKNLEGEAVKLFGREVSGSIIPKLKSAAAGLTKGDVSTFNKLMTALPESRRSEVAATLLNDIFTTGSRKGGRLGGGFAGAFDGLNRNIAAKNALFKHLPPESRKRFDKIGTVATGIFKAKAFENPSRTAIARNIVDAMDDGSIFSRIYKVGKTAVAAEAITTIAGFPGTGATTAILVDALSRKPTSAMKKADAMLTSRAFERSIEEALKGNTQKANKIISGSQKFKNWLPTVSRRDAADIAAIGFIPWLVNQESTKAAQDANN